MARLEQNHSVEKYVIQVDLVGAGAASDAGLLVNIFGIEHHRAYLTATLEKIVVLIALKVKRAEGSFSSAR